MSSRRATDIKTSTSHLLVYQLQPTSQPAYEDPPSSFPPAVGAGEGEPLFGFSLKPLGAAFIMGGVTAVLSQPHALLIGLKHPPSILTVPWPIPTEHLSPAGSHFPPAPLDGGETSAEGFHHWDLAEAREWISDHSEFTGLRRWQS
jgi:hypothetical protein